MADVWVIYRVLCTMCGYTQEFQSEASARSHINEHQRNHDNAPTNWTKPVTNPTQIGTRDQVTQLVIDLARVSPHSYTWLNDQVSYLRSCGMFSTFAEMEKFARHWIEKGIAPEAIARLAIDGF